MSDRPLVVLGRPAEAELLACRLAAAGGGLLVAARGGRDDGPQVPLPALRRGRRLASRLGQAGIDALGRGTIAVVEAGEERLDPVVLAVAAATGRQPVVALLRPRSEEDEPLLARSLAVFAAGAPAPAQEILLEELAVLGAGTDVLDVPQGAAALMARAGIPPGPLADDSGQASVETVALVPLLLAVVLAAGQLLAAGMAREMAGHAATAGAAALIQGRDGRQAARLALPGWARDRARVAVNGRQVTVRLKPPGPGPVAGVLEAGRVADAGPAP